MHKIVHFIKSRSVFIVLFWLLGTATGILTAYFILRSSPVLLVEDAFCFPSVFASFMMAVISVAVIYGLLRFRILLFIALFLRAFLYGFSFCYLHIAGGIMYRSVIIFPHCISSVVILILCLSVLQNHFFNHRKVF